MGDRSAVIISGGRIAPSSGVYIHGGLLKAKAGRREGGNTALARLIHCIDGRVVTSPSAAGRPRQPPRDRYRVQISEDLSDYEKCERQLLARGVSLPLAHRSAWLRAVKPDELLLVSVVDGRGDCSCAFAAHTIRSRALPGHHTVRVERFPSLPDPAASIAGLEALAESASEDWRVLRLTIELFDRDSDRRAQIGAALEAKNFRAARRSRMYSHTVQIDLRPDEHEIFASLHGTARRHIRAVEKRPVRICPIEDRTYAPRLSAVLRETLKRTGGKYRPVDWESVIEFTKGNPTMGRLVGLWAIGATGPESLLAFALGLGHGDNVQYATAGSVRRPDLRWPLGYALAWDLVVWAKSVGAAWFDFGGITEGHASDSNDALGGISDFKRYFTREKVYVGEEWVLEPRRMRGMLSRTISSGAAWAGAVLRRLSR